MNAVRAGWAGAASTAPTEELMHPLVQAYAYFNRELFNDALPDPLITMDRKARGEVDFVPRQFVNLQGAIRHAVVVNPACLATRSLRHVLAALVRSMVDIQLAEAGQGSNSNYRGRRWAEAMQVVGLIPRLRGAADGKPTNRSMAHEIERGGPFDVAARTLIESGYRITWMGRQALPPLQDDPDTPIGDVLLQRIGTGDAHVAGAATQRAMAHQDELLCVAAEARAPRARTPRIEYACPTPGCATRAWSQPAMPLHCGRCRVPMTAARTNATPPAQMSNHQGQSHDHTR